MLFVAAHRHQVFLRRRIYGLRNRDAARPAHGGDEGACRGTVPHPRRWVRVQDGRGRDEYADELAQARARRVSGREFFFQFLVFWLLSRCL